uniref:Uncharacterized protein n=1 Tax=Zooxanthella nutricula TaxID=1333877 RepID=A0A7S2HIE8_9DINO
MGEHGLPSMPSFASSAAEDDTPEESPLIGSDRSARSAVPPGGPADGAAPGQRAWGRQSQIVWAVPLAGVVVLLLAGLAVSTAGGPVGIGQGHAPAPVEILEPEVTPRQLFESPRFVDVATENVIALSQGAIPTSMKPQVRVVVDRHLKQLSADTWQRFPQEGERLNALSLSPEEQDGLLTMMRSVSNPRVHQLGRDVGLFVHQSLGMAHSSDDVKSHVVESLEPKLAEIRQLRDEVIPEAVRGDGGGGDSGSLVVNTDGVNFMSSFDNWDVEVDVSSPTFGESGPASAPRRLGSSDDDGESSMLDNAVKLAKMHAQAEKFFKQVQTFAAEKYNVHVPDMKEAFRGVDTAAATKCAMEAAVTMNPKAAMTCTMQFWSIAMDVMQNIMKGVGPVTTSTEQHSFASFDDLMN